MSEQTPPKHDPQQVAEAVREGMFANDHASRGLGMHIEAVAPGYARIVMTVRKDMLNDGIEMLEAAGVKNVTGKDGDGTPGTA